MIFFYIVARKKYNEKFDICRLILKYNTRYSYIIKNI